MSWFKRQTEFEDLSTADDLAAAMATSDDRPVVLFKHSEMCGSSYRAQREVKKLADEIDVFRLVVQRAREVSRIVEDTMSIRHQTPQAILVHHRVPVFHASHGRVTAEALRKEIEAIDLQDEI